MKTLPIEPGAGSPSHTGWVGTIDEFRLDPHEFTPATEFWVRRVKLAALERAGSSYRIAWNYDAQNSGATLSLWYDSDRGGFNGTRIVDGVAPTAGAYTWNTAGLVPGQEYYIYSQLTDSPAASSAGAMRSGRSSAAAARRLPRRRRLPAGRPCRSTSRPTGRPSRSRSRSRDGPWTAARRAVSASTSSTSGPIRTRGRARRRCIWDRHATGGSRPDIAAAFGAQFAGAGYGIAVKGLPPAVYQIVAFAHSTVSGHIRRRRGP